jgi:hypothetical protein
MNVRLHQSTEGRKKKAKPKPEARTRTADSTRVDSRSVSLRAKGKRSERRG